MAIRTLKIWTELTRGTVPSLAESIWRTGNTDAAMGGLEDRYTTVFSGSPLVLCEYVIPRWYSSWSELHWELWLTGGTGFHKAYDFADQVDTEDFYLHTYGTSDRSARRNTPYATPMMNVANRFYREFIKDWMIEIFDNGSGSPRFTHLLIDTPIWYSQFNEGALENVEEFYGQDITDWHAYGIQCIWYKRYLEEALSGYFGQQIKVMPNFGSGTFMGRTDYPSKVLEDESYDVYIQILDTFQGNGFLNYERITGYQATLSGFAAQGKNLWTGWNDSSDGFPGTGTTSGKTFLAALSFILNQDTVDHYWMYRSAEDGAEDLMSWHYNPFMHYNIGSAITDVSTISGTMLTRQYNYGSTATLVNVYANMKLKDIALASSTPVVVDVPSGYSTHYLMVEGSSYSAAASIALYTDPTLTVQPNTGAILISFSA